MSKKMAIAATALAAIVISAVPGSASAHGGGNRTRPDHWGVITRNTVGSPVAALRNGPFGSFGVQGPSARPPYGQGSLGIEVADHSTTLNPPSEKVDFGNEVDFYGDPVLGLNQVGFHVFQTSENIAYGGGGAAGARNLPSIRFEIDPNLTANPTNHYTTMVWVPDASPVTDRWSPYLDATTTGTWFLTGNAGLVTGCNQNTPCTFQQVKAALNDGGPAPTIYSVAVGKGPDFVWVGAVDGLRVNRTVYDFEADGVRTRQVR
ncbi:hypothetical protein POF50_031285 [Streptomyces sp. SL13]|uniref:Uncharacterized protein n=1 Tax=Streptantibioticus silvisoli TaxID=2705255 RepID=A0AA90HCE5_9ACTN|nr:hypothetical protein [Streptantibioticus silvisoli]MDI5973772.1 hypothetical protein [Streptantibioticus silvisoli]